MATYPSSLTDTEWEILEPLLPPKTDTMRGRPVECPRRAIIDGILYILRTGGAWRMMPNDLPHWKTCIITSGCGPNWAIGNAFTMQYGNGRAWPLEKKPHPRARRDVPKLDKADELLIPLR